MTNRGRKFGATAAEWKSLDQAIDCTVDELEDMGLQRTNRKVAHRKINLVAVWHGDREYRAAIRDVLEQAADLTLRNRFGK